MASPTILGFILNFILIIAAAQSSNVIDLGYAQYRGIQNTSLGLTTYYGLPYAQSPIGDLRWQPPQPIDANGTVLGADIINATELGPQCPQFVPPWFLDSLVGASSASAPVLQPTSEDCLRLDVIVPSQPMSSSLPVVVQIHGGGFTIGSTLTYDGHQFAAVANGSLIYVQIQYRLGPYGFLSGSEIMVNGTANAGLLDQREALEWVKRHIAAFGGNPDQVTIWGGSAGGSSVTNQLILRGGEDENPPFAAAIAEYPWWQPFHDEQILEAQYGGILNETGCDSLTCLRALDSETLTNASMSAYLRSYESGLFEFGDFWFGPSVDGQVIRDLPSNEYKQGHFLRVPTLVDHNAYEGVIFTNLSISSSEVVSDLQTLWADTGSSSSFYTRLLQLYPLSSFDATSGFLSDPIFMNYSAIAVSASSAGSIADPPAFYQRQTIFADVFVNCPTYYVANALVDAGVPVWKLQFAAGLEIHGATMSYLLSSSQLSSPVEYGAWMKDYFISFIVSHDPNASPMMQGKVEWPQYLSVSDDTNELSFLVLEFNQTEVGVVQDRDASARCDFWHGQSYQVRN